ncbi:MAG TPA: pyridoxal-phosphate dependent enzyme [Ignavibacteria bacterium]|nr:pyridoxal-phosphate dependent enzyme [Ignavibacteria bacterium]
MVEKILLNRITDNAIAGSGVELFMLRLDLLHPEISGNKWYKLKYNLEEARKQNKNTLLTFGGAFSNHIAATAAAGKENNFNTIGIIRGEELADESNATLSRAKQNGMKLVFVSREDYRKRFREDFITELKNKYSDPYIIPEGGSNLLAVKGCAEIISDVTDSFDFVCCAVGTGATLAGLSASLSKKQQAIGFSVLANAEFLNDNVGDFIKEFSGNEIPNWKIIHNYHFGGYAHKTKALIDFIQQFEMENNISLEPIYTGKMMYGIYDLIQSGYFTRGEKIIAVHTGGLQGKKS